MKILMLYRLVRYIVTYHLLSSLVVVFVLEIDGALGRSDLKTKLLLQNIRTHLAQKVDEIVKKKECESGLILCKNQKSKETEGKEDKSEEIPPPPKLVRGQHKFAVKVNSKDVIHALMPKARKSLFRKTQKPKENDKHQKISIFGEKSKESNEENESDNASTDKSKEANNNLILKKPLKSFKHPLKMKEKLRQETDVKLTKEKVKDELNLQIDKTNNENITEKVKIKSAIKKSREMEGAKKNKELADSAERSGKTLEEKLIFQPQALVFVLDSGGLQDNLCEKHSQIYLKQLRKYKIWALMMYDASGKFTSGFLQGNVNQYGDFDECLAINAVFKNLKHKSKAFPGIKGKYCLASIDVTTESESRNLRLALERVESFQFIKSTIQDPGHFIPRFSTINWGVCVPSACLAEDVEKFLVSQLEVYSNATGLQFNVDVNESNCVVKDDLKFTFETGTVMTIIFYVIVLIISLYATFLDTRTSKRDESFLEEEKRIKRGLEEAAKDEAIQSELETQKNKSELKKEVKLSFRDKSREIIMAFSIKKNLALLISDTNKGAIECINGIKSIFTVMLYVAHKTIPLGMTPFSNRIFLTKISNQPITILLRASIIYTDSFLLISGVLTSYNLAKEISEKKNVSWAKKAFARFIRLTPALFAVVLFYAYIWDRLGSGPIWNLIVYRSASLCREHMWKNLLYIQNFYAFENMCAPQTHQLALDMQLSLLAPIFIHLIQVYDKAGLGILQALFILSSIMRYISASNNELSVVIYHGMPVSQLYKTANLLYSQTFHRASPYILGVIVGYYLEKFGSKVYIPKAFAALGWILSFTFGFYSIVTPSPLALRTYQYDVQEAAQYAALSPVAWSFALSWLIVACHSGYGGILNDFLCRKIFLVFSRISYSIYLTQFLVFFYKVGVKRIPEMFTVADSLNVNEFFTVIGVSVIVTLLFDIPMMKIKKIILDKNISVSNEPEDGTKSKQPEDIQKKYDKKTQIIPSEDSQDVEEEQIEEESEYEYKSKQNERIEDEDEDENDFYNDNDGNNDDIDDAVTDDDNGGDDDDDDDDDDDEKIYGEDEEGDNKYFKKETIDDELVVEEVLRIRPKKRSTGMQIMDDFEEEEPLQIELDTENKQK